MPNKDAKVYTVSEINRRINDVLTDSFMSVWVEGEVSNYKKHPVSGHTYLTLKDEKAQLSSVIFKSAGDRVKFEIKDGLKVLCFGKIGVYQVQGKYQLYIEKVEPQGYGALQLAFEQLKEKLEKEGLFKEEHKKPVPLLPRKIGLITSSSGAAIKDILNSIDRRFSNVHIILNPVRVQGEGAALEIARAVEEFNRLEGVDVLIVGRGGGSLEALWAFNEEVVARAIFASKIPIISAVGHQKDYLISDFTADVRAATPTKAAEMVISAKSELGEKLFNYSRRLVTGLRQCLQKLEKNLSSLAKSRFFKDPQELIRQKQQQLDEIANYFARAFSHFIQLKKSDFKTHCAKLDALSPLAVLGRGYSIVRGRTTDKVIKSVKDVIKGDVLETTLSDGKFSSVVREIHNAGN
ncbi:MAG: exodeoxyribonuclease VII large subunit [Candidatus Omnitrophica bacterium]|nr:exodeoxyribonuclease VII large subunit [Candidatus Omnitrophota bacterium]